MKTNHLTNKFCLVLLLTFGTIAFAQDTDTEKTPIETIKIIAEKACECTREISVELPKDSIVSKINSCITTFIVEDQTTKQISEVGEILEKALEAKKDTVIAQNEAYMIIVDKDFDEIQAYMFKNCSAVKSLMSANNEKSNLSMSKNKKALKFYEEGQNYSMREQYDMAIVSYKKAVKADPKFAFAWDNLGISYRKMGNYKEAIKCYEKSLEIDPSGTMPLQNMAAAYSFLEDYESAAKTYTKYIELYPDDPEGYFGAGRVFYLSGNYEKGVDNMFKAYKIYAEAKSPYINDAQQNLGYYYQDLEKKGKLDVFIEAAKKNDIQIQE